MLADQLDYVIGVDPHRDSHALAVVHVISGAVVFEATVAASSDGYAQALKLVDQLRAGQRASRHARSRRCSRRSSPRRRPAR